MAQNLLLIKIDTYFCLMIKKSFLLLFFLMFLQFSAQNIKTIQLRPLQENNFSAIVPLGTILELSFDDLDADSKTYYYKIEHMTHDWKPSRVLYNQYINGFQKNTIINVNNSFNTLQNYTHYSVQIPNQNTVITKSGNYLVTVLDEYDEFIFSRRFTLYEQNTIVAVNVNRSRNTKTFNEQQTVEFTVNHSNLRINNPNQEVHVTVLQNNNWETAKTDLQPTFFKPNQLVYSYTKNSNFWGGNEYLNFDNKIVRNKSLNIRLIEKKDIYYNYLYPFEFEENPIYTYSPDINGQFLVRTLEGNNPETEADYALMIFTLQVDEPFADKDVYVYGAFNNFETSEENKMFFDEKSKQYVANILLKQGFYNYTFITKDSNEKVDLGFITGNFYQTENEYTVLVYFKPFAGLIERVVGAGSAVFEGER